MNWIYLEDGDYARDVTQLLSKYRNSPYRNRAVMKNNSWIAIKAPARDRYALSKWSVQVPAVSATDPLVATFGWVTETEIAYPSTEWIAKPIIHLEFVTYMDCRLDPNMKNHASVHPGEAYKGKDTGGVG